MVTIFVFDATLDKIDVEEDPLKTLTKTLERQQRIYNTLVRLRTRVSKMTDLDKRDDVIKSEVAVIQKEIRALAQYDLLECVGECMDESELKVKSASVFERILKIVMSAMMFIQVFNYATTGSKSSKGGKRRRK